ncbi:MAG: aminoglycoside phosphotransferase family protein [Alphaproteobacteria bacterium]|nr:aminoglycoside phosphotransferase family protein [Alphaproteobacteria bacterium]
MNTAMPLSDSELFATARRLTRSAGCPAPVMLERLVGGRNNRVFRVATEGGPSLFLKSYFHDPRDPRERLSAEWSFLTYAWDKGIRLVPEPLAADWNHHTGLYAFVTGCKIAPDEVSWTHLEAAADFLVALNAPPRRLEDMPPASEACFSLAEHMALVDGRVARLANLDSNVPYCEQAQCFVRTKLTPIWKKLKHEIEEQGLTLGLTATLDDTETIISPSDFGFHNMLVADDGRLMFTDFEYAGRDDPAKLVCDFFCQPEMPAPMEYYERFKARLFDGLGLGPSHKTRCSLLLDVYRIKWTCIILNDFRTVGAVQRAFAGDDARFERYAAQLAKAEMKLSEVV